MTGTLERGPCVALTGSGSPRGGVEGALRAAGFTVFDAPEHPAGPAHDAPGDPASGADVAVAVAVGDDLRGVAWARRVGVPCVLVRDVAPGPDDLVEAVMTGADGVVTAETSVDEFLQAVHTVIDGRLALSPSDARCLVDRLRNDVWASRPRVELTPRQQAVLELIVSGVSVKQTARTLGIAVKTVENTQSRLYRRLGVRNRAQAVAVAMSEGLVRAGEEHASAVAGGESPATVEG